MPTGEQQFGSLRIRTQGGEHLNRSAVIKAAYFACLAMNQDLSVRTLMAMIRRIAGRGIRQEEVRLFLADRKRDTLGIQSGHITGHEDQARLGSDRTQPETQLGHLRAGVVKEYYKNITDTNVSDTAAPAPPSPPVDKPKRKGRSEQADVPFDAGLGTVEPYKRPEMDDPSQPLWVRQMREWSVAIVNRKLSELTPDELLKLARYHAWRWANCTADAKKNIAAAGRIVCGIKTLADDRRYGATTVNDYIVAGDDLWEKQGRKPMHPVWPIISQLENAA